ncbi:RHS repeat-associated core domain-containing protein [Arthrobacter sp. APC 3897]|uniref:RHS repeat domain-containing protein n=1 Tax=Arthrobacter sp. APC 3897 TaxID=3035204 RepID=UPI0025B3ED55|nr:RHS repeat-associated core domain-containing protein [Arthrobacter sp. APC 3897]MDN3482858.1 RHS repeat-associated core domain-containing protein [Arthrobacter sp. APC 3897]
MAGKGSLCRTTDGNGNATTYTYDAQGNVASIIRPAPLGAIVNTYDAAGRVATSKDGKNQTATYTYDANDRIQQVRYASTCVPATCVTYTYDGNGNLTKRVDASGTTTYAYDQQNRSTAKTVGTTTTSLTYDGASNILSFVDPTGTIGYRYDAANRLTALAEPGGSCPATPVFPNTTKCVGFGYDKSNRRTTTTYPNGVKNTTVFDNAGRVTETRANTSAGAVLTSRAYTYTSGGTGKDGSLQATVKTEANALTTYGYDTHNRLTAATLGAVTETWVYDKNGNRTSATKTGKPTLTSVYNAADQLCWTAASTGSCASAPTGATTYTYDTNGNTTKAGANTSAYNALDQFTSTTVSGTTTSFAYAGLRNDERTVSGNTSFLNGSLGVTTQTTNGATTSFIRDPDGKLISMRNSAGASYYYTTDALGSVILLTDANQAKAATYSYDSWGNTTQSGAQAGNNPYQYVSGYKDAATGYTKFGARYYNPAIGRFTQIDPSGQDPHYSYAGNNPITSSDTSGLFSLGDAVSGAITAGAIAGGIALGCAATLGGCAVAGAAAFGAGFGAVGGLTGGAIGAKIDGGSQDEIDDAALSGFGRGALSGATTGARNVYMDRIAGWSKWL